MRLTLLAGLAAIGLSACTTSVQTSSGQDYLSRSERALAQADRSASALGGAAISADAFRAAASVEPLLRFPARLGIARVENGALTPIPDEEMVHWAALAEATGGAYGEMVPLNLLVTAMAVPEDQLSALDGTSRARGLARIRRAVDAMRIGAARQHMDALLVYEVFATDDARRNPLSVGDLTILGAFVLPGREVDALGHAEAMLIDVRNAYPYMTASETVTREGLSTAMNRRQRGEDLKRAAKAQAVAEMTDDMPAALARLAVELGNKD